MWEKPHHDLDRKIASLTALARVAHDEENTYKPSLDCVVLDPSAQQREHYTALAPLRDDDNWLTPQNCCHPHEIRAPSPRQALGVQKQAKHPSHRRLADEAPQTKALQYLKGNDWNAAPDYTPNCR